MRIPLDASAIETSPPILDPSLNRPNPAFSRYRAPFSPAPLEVSETHFHSRPLEFRAHVLYYPENFVFSLTRASEIRI